MRALFFDGAKAEVVDRPEPDLKAGWALVRVHLAGVCNTDLELCRGYMGFQGILGHELVGEVLAGPAEWLGKRVVCEINFACGACEMCTRGLGRHCPKRTVMGILNADGAMAERILVPVANLHEVAAGVSDEAAVFAEPLAAACEILEQVHVTAATRCTVLGDGKLGLLVAQVLHQAGARVLAVGKHEDKLGILKARGMETVLFRDWDRTPRDLVVEATGTAEGLATAIGATLPRGTLVLKSTVADESKLHLAPIVINEISVVGSRCGSFPPALRAIETASIDTRSLVSERVPLARAHEALSLAAKPGVRKVIIVVRES
ncbi:MAG: alcohol dehydrogenase catalytic domain-containing protein [Polyangiaceae bacterium]|nr:alcohol dehydrogenase catalytic domain-containing protein [Polyangiaceae bacterium]